MSGLRDVSLDRRRCRGEELVSVSISERRRRLLSLFLSCLASPLLEGRCGRFCVVAGLLVIDTRGGGGGGGGGESDYVIRVIKRSGDYYCNHDLLRSPVAGAVPLTPSLGVTPSCSCLPAVAVGALAFVTAILISHHHRRRRRLYRGPRSRAYLLL